MPTTTVLKIINGALRLNGNSNPNAEDRTFALDALNAMLEAWSMNVYNIYVNVKEDLTLVASQATYTLGVGGDLNSARPEAILDIYWNDNANDQRIYVKPITEQEYDDITDQTVEGRPTKWFMAPEYPLAKLYLYPVPNDTDTLKITSTKPFTTVAIDDSFTLPNGYDRAIRFNLAVELAPEDGMSPDPKVESVAASSLNDIKNKNATSLIMVTDVPRGSRTRYKRPFNINILE